MSKRCYRHAEKGVGVVEMIDFDACERVRGRGYRDNAGRKLPCLYDGGLWMVKFQGSTRNMAGAHLPSYTSSSVSEYIGSHIYEALGIDAHETVLGRCAGKIVVGCRDFTEHATLLEYSQIKNTVDDEFISGSYGSGAAGERLSDVVRVIGACDEFEGIRDAVVERFWDMFVVDAFIHNNDRNNGNWGLLVARGSVTPAPVYGNGNAFFNKRGPTSSENAWTRSACSGRTRFPAARFP